MNKINRTYGGNASGSILRIAIGISVLIIVMAAFTGNASAASRSSKNIGYVNYDDSGFTGSSVPSGNIFATSVVSGPAPTSLTNDSVIYNNMTFTPLTKASLSATTLALYDTLILFQICDIATSLNASQHAAINDYLTKGNKIILYDGDRCALPGPNVVGDVGGVANYSWFTYPFSTSSPGPQGKSGTLTIVENSRLTSGLASDPFNADELGDANTVTTSDPHWFAAANTTNALGNYGYFLAYARNSGLIIYDGADYWYTWYPTKSLTDLFLNELNQQYNPDELPGSVPIAPTVHITASPDMHDITASTNFTFTANPVGSWGNNIQYSWSISHEKCYTAAVVFTGQGISQYLSAGCGNATISVSAEDEKGNVAHDTYVVTVHENVAPTPTPTPTPGTCLGDITGDSNVNSDDFVLFASAYNSASGDLKYNIKADLNNDGVINSNDFVLFAWVYEKACSPQAPPNPTLTVDKVWTMDVNNQDKTSFLLGDSIRYAALVKNGGSSTVKATFKFLASGPKQIYSWTGQRDVVPGSPTIYSQPTIPADTPAGTYTLTVTVDYNGQSSSKQSQFQVLKNPINPILTPFSCSDAPLTFPISIVDEKNSYIGWLYKEDTRGWGQNPDISILHSGLDFWASPGTPVLGQATGQVIRNPPNDYGWTISYPGITYIGNDGIKKTGKVFVYIDNLVDGNVNGKTVKVLKQGEDVVVGEIIGFMGEGGANIGGKYHIHWSVSPEDQTDQSLIDPKDPSKAIQLDPTSLLTPNGNLNANGEKPWINNELSWWCDGTPWGKAT